MPLSFLTRLRGTIVAAISGICLLCLDMMPQGWIFPVIAPITPFLIWMLVSGAVKDSPPLDDTAFHRTRPSMPARIFRHMVGFHLLLLAGILVLPVAYGWYARVGIREIAIGTGYVAMFWIAMVSIFATVASLATSRHHWKGWAPLAGLLIPALSTFAMAWISAKNHGQPRGYSPSIAGMGLIAMFVYPILWWLVAVKRNWGLGCGLALLAGTLLPWASPLLAVADLSQGRNEHRYPAQGLEMRRIAPPGDLGDMSTSQTPVSRLIEVKGLAQGEFIAGLHLCKRMDKARPGYEMVSDIVLSEMNGAAFAIDGTGRMAPAFTSLFHAAGLEIRDEAELPVWRSFPPHRGDDDDLKVSRALMIPPRSEIDDNPGRSPVSAETARLAWEFSGHKYRWLKVLEANASEGGRAELPGGGIVELTPPEKYPGHFQITLRIIRGRHARQRVWGHPLPALIARTADGRTGFVKLEGTFAYDHTSFLTRRNSLQFFKEVLYPQDLAELRGARLEVYWPEYQGSFQTMLPPVE